MKILYYAWELSAGDIPATLKELGHELFILEGTGIGVAESEELFDSIKRQLSNGFDAVFSVDYFPTISRACQERDVLYIAWIWDCPHLTLASKTVTNSCNRLFSFDFIQTQQLLQRKARVRYLPLAVKVSRLKNLIERKQGAALSPDVSFIGNFKSEEDLLEKIQGMPEQLRGYIDGVIEAQLKLFGYDLIGECIVKEQILSLARLAPVFDPPDYETDRKELYTDWIRKRASILERRRLIQKVADHYPVSVASMEDPKIAGVSWIGAVNYYETMPLIFNHSKVNLNITMRTIRHGIPLRVIDILGAGGFLITNYQPDFSNYFQNGRELVWFDSEEQLTELVGYYLEHEKERRAIAEAGQRAAERYFDHSVLLREMFRQL